MPHCLAFCPRRRENGERALARFNSFHAGWSCEFNSVWNVSLLIVFTKVACIRPNRAENSTVLYFFGILQVRMGHGLLFQMNRGLLPLALNL